VPDDLPNQRFSYLQHLVYGTLPSDLAKARRLACRAKTFVLINGEMYKRSASGVLMWCITHKEGTDLLWKIHLGACGYHTAPRTLEGNVFR
jgi:hypothetical protein